MGWGRSLLAGIGGAARGAAQQTQFDQQQAQIQEAAELRLLLALTQEDGRNSRAAAIEEGKAAGRADARAKADADRELRTRQVAGNLEHLWRSDDLHAQELDERRRLNDMVDARFWEGTLPLSYRRDATDRRGQDISAHIAERGQDTNVDNAWLTASLRANVANQTAATRQREQDLRDARERQRRAADDAARLGKEPPPVGDIPLSAAIPAVPIPQRRTPAASLAPKKPVVTAPTPTQQPVPQSMKVGAVVRLKNGERMRVVAIYDDGFEAEPVQ